MTSERERTRLCGIYGAFFWSDTYLTTNKLRYVWAIRNFDSCLTSGLETEMVSPNFKEDHQTDPTWSLVCNKNREYLSIGLTMSSSSSSCRQVQVACSLSLLDSNGKELLKKHITGDYLECVLTYKPNSCHRIVNYISLSTLNTGKLKYLRNGNLVILCNMSLHESIEVVAEGKKPPTPPTSKFEISGPSLSEDFGELFRSQKSCDITFEVDGKEVKAHQNIITARSPVFDAMFRHQTRENLEKRVEITGIDLQTFQEMLRYIYTDRVADIASISEELLVAADRYGLERLKSMCERAIYEKISEDNAVELLLFADRHSAKQLKENICKFIKLRFEGVKETEKWKKLTE